jgi:hypothetical protein
MFSLRYVDPELERPRWRSTASWSVLPTVQVGIEYNPVASEVGPLATIFLATETENRPALFLGTSSDRIGSPEGKQAYYLTAAKYIPALRVAPYMSLNYSEWDQGWNVPFGASLELGRGFSIRPMYDGNETHLIGSYATDRISVSALWVWLERAGLAVSFGF